MPRNWLLDLHNSTLDPMRNAIPIVLALTTAISMAVGQILFKFGAAKIGGDGLVQYLFAFLKSPTLVSAVFLYAATVLIWVYVLRTLPLSTAYPLTAMSYVIVPVLSYVFLKEAVSVQVIVGSSLIILGVIVTHLKIA